MDTTLALRATTTDGAGLEAPKSNSYPNDLQPWKPPMLFQFCKVFLLPVARSKLESAVFFLFVFFTLGDRFCFARRLGGPLPNLHVGGLKSTSRNRPHGGEIEIRTSPQQPGPSDMIGRQVCRAAHPSPRAVHPSRRGNLVVRKIAGNENSKWAPTQAGTSSRPKAPGTCRRHTPRVGSVMLPPQASRPHSQSDRALDPRPERRPAQAAPLTFQHLPAI